MKILLGAVNAKYIHSNLAVYSLRAYAVPYREEITLREYTINQQEDQILRDIWQEQPDILFLSCYIWNISLVRGIIRDIHQLLPDMPIWVGGPEVSYDAPDFLRENPQVTGVLKGEGEETFLQVLDYYHGKAPNLTNIQGIALRMETGIQDNSCQPILDMNDIPFPYEEEDVKNSRIIYYESSRGCPFACSYCLSSIDRKLRFRGLDKVKEELQFFIDCQVPQVKFVDRTFNCSHSHAMEIWQYLIDHDRGKTNFHFEIAADLLTKEEITLMKSMRPGLIQLEIGVQSVNPRTLEEIRRKMDFTRVSWAVGQIKAGGNIHQHLDLIAGLPWEDYDSFRESFDRVYALEPEQLQLGFLKVLKGSYMADKAEEYQCRYKGREPYEVLSTKWLPYGDVLKLKQVESMVEVYYNSRQFTMALPEILEFYDSPFRFYEALGEYHRQQGYDEISHSRMRRYEILLEFLQAEGRMDMERIRELLTWDLYLRENLKSRTGWMSDQSSYQKDIRTYIREHDLPRTVHIEVFSRETVLFDYTRRDPLTNNTQGIRIELHSSGK